MQVNELANIVKRHPPTPGPIEPPQVLQIRPRPIGESQLLEDPIEQIGREGRFARLPHHPAVRAGSACATAPVSTGAARSGSLTWVARTRAVLRAVAVRNRNAVP